VDGTADAQEPGSRSPTWGARHDSLACAGTAGSGCFAEAARLIDPGIAANRAGTDVLRAREGEDDHLMINAAIVGHHKRHAPMGTVAWSALKPMPPAPIMPLPWLPIMAPPRAAGWAGAH